MRKCIPIFLAFCLFLSCSKDEDLVVTQTVDPLPGADVDVEDFMWKAMNFWYFWQEQIPVLADDRFSNDEAGRRAYTNFLGSQNDPGSLFDNELLFIEDRFSYYNEDYRNITNALSGISKSNGLEFGLVGIDNTTDIFGYVQYIIPNSDAALKDIRRGEFFYAVDGRTLNRDNYIELLFGANDTYTLPWPIW